MFFFFITLVKMIHYIYQSYKRIINFDDFIRRHFYYSFQFVLVSLFLQVEINFTGRIS